MRALAILLSTFFLVPCVAVSRLGEGSRVMSGAARFVAPSFCHGLDCPTFDTVSSSASYEVRRYAPSVWVSTVVTGPAYDKAVNSGFMALFGYIGGANTAATKIDMTTPVLVDVNPGPGPTCGNNFTVAFYAGGEGTTPPSPTNPELFVRNVPERTAYVASYGGWASESTVLAKASQLAAALTADGREFLDGVFLTASYDSPFRLLGRHNEVWLLAK
jgi:hypothetical protein